MCGIVAVKRKDKKPAARAVLKRYREQRGRGTQGFGYVAIHDNKVVSYQRAPTEHEIVKKMEAEYAEEIIFHHRYPTSTPNFEEQAHPLYIKNAKNLEHEYFIIHNGVIRNTDRRREDHFKDGIPYVTEMDVLYKIGKKVYNTGVKWNDSESIAVDTALFLEGTSNYISSGGTAAVIAIQVQGKKVVNRFFYRNSGNPLTFFEDNNMQTWTSTGKGKDLDPIVLYYLNEKGEFVPHSKKMYGPYSYNDTHHQTPGPWKGKTQEETVDDYLRKNRHMDLSDLGGFEDGNIFPDEERTTPMGFLTDGRDDDPNDITIEAALERADINPSLDDDAPELFSEIDGIRSDKFKFIVNMDEMTLWNEWERTDSAVKHLSKVVEKMDERMAGFDTLDNESLDVRAEMQLKLDSLKQYANMIDSRLTLLESGVIEAK